MSIRRYAVAFSGTWQSGPAVVAEDVRREVESALAENRVVVTGGALGVDYITTARVIELQSSLDSLRVVLPVKLQVYIDHYRRQADQAVVTHAEVEELIHQLQHVSDCNPHGIVEGPADSVDQKSYYDRNSAIVEISDALRAFQVNESPGTQDTILKARAKGIVIRHYRYLWDPDLDLLDRSVSDEEARGSVRLAQRRSLP